MNLPVVHMVKVHFLNVGHGDCTIIEHASGRLTMVDINNGDDIDEQSAEEIAAVTPSPFDDILVRHAKLLERKRTDILKEAGYNVELTNPVKFFKWMYPGRSIFRYIQTHPHLDHMRGLAALNNEGISIANFWDTNHTFVPKLSGESDRGDFAEYQKLRTGVRGANVHLFQRGDHYAYFNRDNESSTVNGGDGLFILHPVDTLQKTDFSTGKAVNNLSYVLLFVHRGVRVVLGGDAEEEVWDSIYETYGQGLKCHVLKASHHGRDSGYHQKAVKAMSPEYTIVSVGKKPTDVDAHDKYAQYSDNVWSTRWRGHITLTIKDDGTGTVDAQYDDR